MDSDEPFDFTEAPVFQARDYQLAKIANIEEHWVGGFSRQLLEMATGTGKTSVAAILFKKAVAAGQRCLFLANRDKLVRQSAKRVREETGLEVEIEMAADRASPYAPVVVASVQTLGRLNRLTSFADTHFDLIVADESHHATAASWLKVLNYFHFGAESLAPEWKAPVRGTYRPKARVLGITATPNEELGAFFDYFVEPAYSLIAAVEDGWLVPPVTKSIPLKIDLRALRMGRTVNGSDFKPEDLSAKLVPVIDALAKQLAIMARDRKTIAFTPSVECARLLAEAVSQYEGMRGIFVSGECLDVDEKTEDYVRAGKGTVLANCALYTEGADFPDTDCIVVARATRSKAFYRQMCGRGTRTLPGTVDGLDTPEARRNAIAASAKPNLLILDPLWIHERIDLCEAFDLLTDKPEVKERMKKIPGDMLLVAREAERDFLAALAKEARKHEKKQPRTIDPLAWAVSVGDAVLASYKPETSADAAPATKGELDFILGQGISTELIKCSGLAQKVIARIVDREKMGLCTPKQMTFLKRLGIAEETASLMKKNQAGAIIGRETAKWRS